MATITIPKKEYRAKIEYPQINEKEYHLAWRNFWRLGKKLNRLWKTKKIASKF